MSESVQRSPLIRAGTIAALPEFRFQHPLNPRLSGRGIAEIGDEEVEVGPGDFMGFATPSSAHHLRNRFDVDLVYLMGGGGRLPAAPQAADPRWRRPPGRCLGRPRVVLEVGVRAHTEYLWFNTRARRELVNITERIAEIVAAAKIAEGLCLVSAMHITAGIWVNDEESGLKQDLVEWLDELAPPGDYRHHQTGEDNADAHLKRTLIHHQVILPITKGKLDLGPWEQVFYAEFDGRRKKRVVVKVIGE